MGGGVSRVTYRKAVTQNRNLSGQKQTQIDRSSLPKRRVFISFHMENEAQVGLLRHQATSDKFNLEFTDYSVKEPFDGNWKRKCEERINQSSVFLCMIGAETYKRPSVLWEINKAYELGKKVIGVRIHKDRKDPIPGPLLRNKAKIINWKIEEIQNAIDEE
ncbi:MAG: TIR domain-containing protein [Nanoarchaeota archaeon]